MHSNHGVICKTFDEAEIYNRNLKFELNVNKLLRSEATAMKLQKNNHKFFWKFELLLFKLINVLNVNIYTIFYILFIKLYCLILYILF